MKSAFAKGREGPSTHPSDFGDSPEFHGLFLYLLNKGTATGLLPMLFIPNAEPTAEFTAEPTAEDTVTSTSTSTSGFPTAGAETNSLSHAHRIFWPGAPGDDSIRTTTTLDAEETSSVGNDGNDDDGTTESTEAAGARLAEYVADSLGPVDAVKAVSEFLNWAVSYPRTADNEPGLAERQGFRTGETVQAGQSINDATGEPIAYAIQAVAATDREPGNEQFSLTEMGVVFRIGSGLWCKATFVHLDYRRQPGVRRSMAQFFPPSWLALDKDLLQAGHEIFLRGMSLPLDERSHPRFYLLLTLFHMAKFTQYVRSSLMQVLAAFDMALGSFPWRDAKSWHGVHNFARTLARPVGIMSAFTQAVRAAIGAIDASTAAAQELRTLLVDDPTTTLEEWGLLIGLAAMLVCMRQEMKILGDFGQSDGLLVDKLAKSILGLGHRPECGWNECGDWTVSNTRFVPVMAERYRGLARASRFALESRVNGHGWEAVGRRWIRFVHSSD